MKCYLLFATTVIIVLAATGVWNPFPDLLRWLDRSEPLAGAHLAWQQRLGGKPRSVTIAGSAIVVEQRTTVEARGLVDGGRLWERKADWAAVAGTGSEAVVAVGTLLVKGYEVLDPANGAVRRKDGDAVAVWTFRDQLLDVHCEGSKNCLLSAWAPRGSAPLWTARLPGVGTGLFADNPRLLGTRPLTVSRVDAGAGGPADRPQLLAFPIDGRVTVVDTSRGAVLPRVDPGRDRVVAVAGRTLRIHARSQDGSCYFTVEGSDAANGTVVWRAPGLNLRTGSGAGCVQRSDPAGARNVVLGVRPDGREVLVDGNDGRTLWTGAEGAGVQALDDRYALVRPAGGEAVVANALGGSRLWRRDVHAKAQAALTPHAAIVLDRDPDRIVALAPATGRVLLELDTSARVVAVGPDGLVVSDRRELAYARFAGPGSGAATPAPGGSTLR